MTFDELVLQATGGRHRPYSYQREMADGGLPEVLAVPTGAGKTLAATLPWLYRRRFHPDSDAQAATPRWLVLTLPMRVLVEQTHQEIEGWLDELGLSDQVGLYRIMGGEGRSEARWRYEPEQDAIFVGTLDMLLSRALNRGYGESRWAWPIDFGLLNTGAQWVFDEVQLMGPGLPTSRQLDGLRRSFGTIGSCSTMWMSATVHRDTLLTVDNPAVEQVVNLPAADRTGPLHKRLNAAKPVHELELPGKSYVTELAEAVLDSHQAGTRTIVIVNTVDRATGLYDEVIRRRPDVDAVLVHSRFRPQDRQNVVTAALADPTGDGPGTIVVSTQVLEAGVDVSATTLLTELAPWPSIVQRAGRCNRDGNDAENASLLWVRPPNARPYEAADLEHAAEALTDLEGGSAAPAALEEVEVVVQEQFHPVLRRRDLVELFDTLPDLSGNDVDVARFIRSSDEIDVHLAWRALGDGPPQDRAPLPSRDERCPVPLGTLRDRKARLNERRVWRYDHVAERWVRCTSRDLRPGQVLIVNADDGGYEPTRGWSPASTTPVAEVSEPTPPSPLTDGDTGVGSDAVSYNRMWVALRRHLGDVEDEVRRLVEVLPFQVPPELAEATALAGRYHDLGKAHQVFQTTLAASAVNDDEIAERDREPRPWAKSGGSHRARHERPHFRHELASALALLSSSSTVLDDLAERDLVVYLVAAHHGRIRLGFRSLPDEKPPDRPDQLFALGVWDGDELPPVDVAGEAETPDEVVPASRLDLSTMLLGRSETGGPSWTERALALRDRTDLGPFRLGTLEALVRVADWKVSAGYDDEAARP